MIEKVNPSHPDKLADRIAGAIVDFAYQTTGAFTSSNDPKIAVEVLLGHGKCDVIIETDTDLDKAVIKNIIYRIAGNVEPVITIVPQDSYLHNNQSDGIRCGDNGIFKGMPITEEQHILSNIAKYIYSKYPYDGKYILDLKSNTCIICQSHAATSELKQLYPSAKINPIGDWFGGIDVDTGATNRKLGSDMADAVTGGGIHGKDLSKADVSVNIYAYLKAQKLNEPVELFCAIGDTTVDGKPYKEIVEIAKNYIKNIGGFEKLAEWGLY